MKGKNIVAVMAIAFFVIFALIGTASATDTNRTVSPIAYLSAENITVTTNATSIVDGESTVTVTTDWNPWDDDGCIITDEIQEAVYCWITDTPMNGHLITTEEMQELVSMWLTT